MHTHLLHLLVRQVPNVYQKQIHSHGQLYTPYPIVPSEPVRVYAVRRELRPQTNLAKPLQPYLVTTLHHQPAVTPALRAPRPAAPLPRVLLELSESTPFAPVRVPALELRRSQQDDHCLGFIQLGLLTDFDAADFTAPPALSAPCLAVPLPRVLHELSASTTLAPVRVPALDPRDSHRSDRSLDFTQLVMLPTVGGKPFSTPSPSASLPMVWRRPTLAPVVSCGLGQRVDVSPPSRLPIPSRFPCYPSPPPPLGLETPTACPGWPNPPASAPVPLPSPQPRSTAPVARHTLPPSPHQSPPRPPAQSQLPAPLSSSLPASSPLFLPYSTPPARDATCAPAHPAALSRPAYLPPYLSPVSCPALRTCLSSVFPAPPLKFEPSVFDVARARAAAGRAPTTRVGVSTGVESAPPLRHCPACPHRTLRRRQTSIAGSETDVGSRSASSSSDAMPTTLPARSTSDTALGRKRTRLPAYRRHARCRRRRARRRRRRRHTSRRRNRVRRLPCRCLPRRSLPCRRPGHRLTCRRLPRCRLPCRRLTCRRLPGRRLPRRRPRATRCSCPQRCATCVRR